MKMDDSVYWAEGNSDGTSVYRQTELVAAPLDVSKCLSKLLFQRGIPVVLTSATLAIRGSLDYFVRRVGFCYGEGLILDTPFHYDRQVTLYLTKNMPQPSDPDFAGEAAERIRHFIDMTKGNAFVLFTSYSLLKNCAERLEEHCQRKGYQLLVHGESLSRSAMLNRFRSTGSSVIFGATSFWTGVDVPGDALSNVIITKLPFAVPNHPLIEARCERIEKCGGNPFRDYSIPEAVLKFRQGIGRLIRSTTDTGIIVVLDPRIVSKSYGRVFLDSIPECPLRYF